MNKLFLLPLLALAPVLTLGCARDAADPGLPSGSLFSSPHDGTLEPNPASGRVSNPNTRDGTPPWESAYFPTGTYPSRSPTPSSPNSGSSSGGAVNTAPRSSAVLPGDQFPYNVGREPLPPRSPAVTVSDPNSYHPASVYPNRSEAARGNRSPSLYPPTPGGTINPDPVRNPTLYPNNGTRGRGYVGP